MADSGIEDTLAASEPNGEDRTGKVWNQARKDGMFAAFTGSTRPHAARTFAKLAPMLDDWMHA